MPKSRKKEDIKKQLLEQGIKMFVNKGYHGTGIQELVDGVGIPKGSFYNYFESKEDFGSAAIETYSEKFKAFLEKMLEDSKKNGYLAIKKSFNEVIKIYEDKSCREGCFLGNMAAEICDSSELVRNSISSCVNQWSDIIKKIILNGQKQKTIRNDIKADKIADFMLNSIEGSLLRMKMESSIKPLLQLKDLFLDYISPE